MLKKSDAGCESAIVYTINVQFGVWAVLLLDTWKRLKVQRSLRSAQKQGLDSLGSSKRHPEV